MEHTPKRQSNFELLRILAMVLIIGHHFSVHGGFYFDTPGYTVNLLALQWLSIGGKVGVSLFVLISGYFLIHTETLRPGKLVTLWLQIFFYSVVIYAISVLTGRTDFSVKELLRAMLPIVSKQWWFASSYFLMYLCAPLLARWLRTLNRKHYLLLLAAQAVFWYIVPLFTRLPERVRDLSWFIFLFAIAGFLRLHRPRWKAGLWLSIGAGLLLASFGYAVILLGFHMNSSRYETAYFQNWQPLLLAAATALFLGFERLTIPHSPAINCLAAASFGIYLLHDSDYTRYLIWQDILNAGSHRDSPALIGYALFAMAAVYAACLALELLRAALVDRLSIKIRAQ